ncbi:MAG: hypothetical protein E6G76_07625 [Alphaproteobacteria bacterium]|nr:MAG: hypothetical protein E6G76_07625 [Alphaproteobacteria bacterium]
MLAQRVIRLLLDRVDPAKILCITFTKAAAANMANRVFDELRRWTALDDSALNAAIKRISNIEPDAARRTLARRLFAMALETPGGLKVQTIHAFCTRLLHHFPFEANVAARFDVLEEAAQAKLLAEISLGVLLDAALAPEGVLGQALAIAIAAASDQTFKDVVGEAIRKRDAVRAWIDHGGSIESARRGRERHDRAGRNGNDGGAAVSGIAMAGSRQAPGARRQERSGAGAAVACSIGGKQLAVRRPLSSGFSDRQARAAPATLHPIDRDLPPPACRVLVRRATAHARTGGAP